MGFIRGSLLFIVSVVFFVTVLLGSIFLTLSLSLKYENVEKEVPLIVENLTEGSFNLFEENFNLTGEMERASEFMINYCYQNYTVQNDTLVLNQSSSASPESSEDSSMSYVFSAGGYVFVIPCSVLDDLDENPHALTEAGISNIVENIYYEEYDCNFWDCFKTVSSDFSFFSLFREKQIEWKGAFFLVSEKARDYWNKKFNSSLVILVVLTVLIFLLIGQKQNAPILIGALIMASSFALLWFENIFKRVTKLYSIFFSLFFSKTGTVFWIIFVSGLIIFGAGMALRFLQADFIKKKFSRKDIVKIIRSETGKDKIKEKDVRKGEKKEKSSEKLKEKKKTEVKDKNKKT